MATQYVPIGGGGGVDFDAVYPVGAIYLSTNATSPSILFGGSWSQIQDQFLLTAGTTYTAGGTGGSAVISANNLPDHSHTCADEGSHSHQEYICMAPRNGSYAFWNFNGEGGSGSFGGMPRTNGGSSHKHTISGGGGSPQQNFLPPYIVVYAWYRTA